MEKKKIRNTTVSSFNWLMLVITLIGLSAILWQVFNHNTKDKIVKEYIYISAEQRLELCPENVLYWCKVFEIKFDTIVVAQSIQECGWNYESYKAQIDHNIFGLQHTSENSFEYSHWIGSLLRYKKMQDTYYKDGDYYEFLENHGYAKDPLYTNKLKQIVKMLNERL